MRKAQLQKIWKQLDQACEAIERLQEEEGIDVRDKWGVDMSAIVSMKNDIEEEIEKKSRK